MCPPRIFASRGVFRVNLHEHSPARVAREHEEEGIGNLDDCARCHRSANEHDIRGGEGRERGEKHHEGRHRHDDDDD